MGKWVISTPRPLTRAELDFASHYERISRENEGLKGFNKGLTPNERKAPSTRLAGGVKTHDFHEKSVSPSISEYGAANASKNTKEFDGTGRTKQKFTSDVSLLSPSSPAGFVIKGGLDDIRPAKGNFMYRFTSDIYESSISIGQTSEVFEVEAFMSWVSTDETQARHGSYVQKMAIKRLSTQKSEEKFLEELESLQKVTKINHPNIVEIIGAFRYASSAKTGPAETFNFAFPLALGNLKRLFRGNYSTNNDIFGSLQTLWVQFEGLASAVAYLHECVRTAHRDIKPSNILIYRANSRADLILKITDFGLSVDLGGAITWEMGTQEAISAWNYDAPEIRQRTAPKSGPNAASPDAVAPRPSQVLKNDIWKLGCVYVELATFLSCGGDKGIKQFSDFIEKTQGNITSDDISDGRFDDGVQVKAEVLSWLSRLSQRNEYCMKLEPIIARMLERQKTRPSASEICRMFSQANVCQRRTWFDGTRSVTLVEPWDLQPPSFFDILKARAERKTGRRIDWWPLRPPHRPCEEGGVHVIWDYNGTRLCVNLPSAIAEPYRQECVPELPNSGGMLLTPLPPDHSGIRNRPSALPRPATSQTQSRNSLTGIGGWLNEVKGWFSSASNRSAEPVLLRDADLHWCVDRAWTEPHKTLMCSIPELDRFKDDSTLYRRLKMEYIRKRGWLRTFFSWKTCTEVEFVENHQFRFVWDGQDQVHPSGTKKLPISDEVYFHGIKTPYEANMSILSVQMVAGLASPTLGSETMETVSVLPRLIKPPHLLQKQFERGFGLHAKQNFSLWKIVSWVLLTETIGLLFVVGWLYWIDKKDLQNAFVPVTYFVTLVGIVLAVPQLLGVA